MADKSKLLNKDIRELEKELKATKKVLSMTKSENQELATFKDRFYTASDTIKKLESEKNELEALFNALGLNEIKQQTNDIKKIKQMLLESLAIEYNEKRTELKNSGMAKQSDYSELKKDNDNKKELIQSTFKRVLTNNVDNVNNSNKNNKNIDIDY
jgi:chromosome segregation ATPase